MVEEHTLIADRLLNSKIKTRDLVLDLTIFSLQERGGISVVWGEPGRLISAVELMVNVGLHNMSSVGSGLVSCIYHSTDS